jgi:hypothetical protein
VAGQILLAVFFVLAANMAGATIVNATVLRNTTFGSSVSLTAVLCAMFVLLAYGRRQQIKDTAEAVRRVKNGGPLREDSDAKRVGHGSGQAL